MSDGQSTRRCRACRMRLPRESFSPQTSRSGRRYRDTICDECRAKRPPANIAVDLPREEWFPVCGYEGLYEISNYTRVRRASDSPQAPKGQLLRQVTNADGYLVVQLSKRDGGKARPVHRLMVEAVAGPIPAGLVVNHIDGCKTNNLLDNLEVVTPEQNDRHARMTGLTDPRGERNPNAILTDDQVREIRADTSPLAVAAARYGVSVSLISLVRLRKAWRHVTEVGEHGQA